MCPGNALTNNYDGSGTYTFGRERADSKLNWNPTSKLTSFARFSLLKFDMYDPPVFGAAGGIDINPQGGQPGNAHGASYSLTASATYMLKSNLILDGYFAWENDNTAVEPDAIGQNVGQQWGFRGPTGRRDTRRVCRGSASRTTACLEPPVARPAASPTTAITRSTRKS